MKNFSIANILGIEDVYEGMPVLDRYDPVADIEEAVVQQPVPSTSQVLVLQHVISCNFFVLECSWTKT
jgi:hypothetical protein